MRDLLSLIMAGGAPRGAFATGAPRPAIPSRGAAALPNKGVSRPPAKTSTAPGENLPKPVLGQLPWPFGPLGAPQPQQPQPMPQQPQPQMYGSQMQGSGPGFKNRLGANQGFGGAGSRVGGGFKSRSY